MEKMENSAVMRALKNSEQARFYETVGVSKSALMYLQEVRTILAPEAKWIKGVTALDVVGKPCKPTDGAACQFSLQGALERVREILSPEWTKAMDLVQEAAGTDNLQRWNNRWWRTHRGVLNLLDRAMERAL